MACTDSPQCASEKPANAGSLVLELMSVRVLSRRLCTFCFCSYPYSAEGYADVDVYVIDTGIYTAHEDFDGKVP